MKTWNYAELQSLLVSVPLVSKMNKNLSLMILQPWHDSDREMHCKE